MSLKPAMLEAMNKQINAEFYSSFLYLAMAAHFESEALPGIATWLKLQADEERGHAMKFFGHVLDRGAKPVLGAIQAPPSQWPSAEEAFKQVLEHEEHVTGLINALAALARKEADFASENFLQYFIKEQVEEEAQAQLLYTQFQMAGASKGSLMMMDHRLGKRAAE
ncbi:MAG TPA: ferritin [bacterium]|jgi:ferritin|nr:ferritin [bacterium]